MPRGIEETNPAWGFIGAYRSQGTPRAVFDSDILHQTTVTVKLAQARRERDLNRDWIRGGFDFVEVEMSEAQWASFISSMNTSGVPCTITQRPTGPVERMPRIEHEPRLKQSMAEVKEASEKAIREVSEAFARYAKKKNAANLRSLEATINNLPSNMTFAASSLSEHAENVVQKARADVEAMVLNKAQQIGLDPAELGDHRLLGSGE